MSSSQSNRIDPTVLEKWFARLKARDPALYSELLKRRSERVARDCQRSDTVLRQVPRKASLRPALSRSEPEAIYPRILLLISWGERNSRAAQQFQTPSRVAVFFITIPSPESGDRNDVARISGCVRAIGAACSLSSMRTRASGSAASVESKC